MKRTGLLVVLLALLGCGADPVFAPRDNVQPLALRDFPKQDWRLANNKFFLWRDDMTPQHASEAIAISKEIDRLDSEALVPNARHLELETLMAPLKEAIETLETEQSAAATLFDSTTTAKGEAEKSLADAQKSLGLEKDPAIQEQIKTEIASLTAAIATHTATLSELDVKKTSLDAALADKTAVLEPLQNEMNSVEAQQYLNFEAGLAQVDKIMTVVDWYKDQPTSVTFQFQKDGTIAASISGWNMGDDLGARNYSTVAAERAKPTMGKVTYNEVGGVFEFEVYVYTDELQENLRETFYFRVGRIKYDYPDGRLFFGGDITRTAADGSIRRGLAKLVDRNN